MSFLNPISLLYLLTIPPVVLLYFLRLRRRSRVVSSTLLWRDAVADLQANAPFQRLRRNLLLFLQVLLLALLAVLIARPFLTLRALSGESEVIVIDGSASMQATDEKPSRLAVAKRAAARIVADLSRGDEACIIEAGGRTRVRAGFTTNKRELQAAIDQVTAGDTETALRDAMALAVSLARKKRGAEIVLISDGALDPLEDLSLGGERVRFVRVGKGSSNVGITAMDARRDYSTRGALQLFVQMTSFADQPTSFVLETYHEDSLVDARPIELPARGSRGEVFADLPYEAGAVRAHIDLNDDLAADNSGYAYLLLRREISVLLVTAGNLFLQKALEVDPRVRVTQTTPTDYTGLGSFDVTVFDGWAPPHLAEGSYLLIHTAADNAPVQVAGEVTTPSVVRWNDRHPLTRHVSFEDVAIADALAVRPRAWGQALVEAEATPLLVCGEEAKIRAVFIGFALERSNLPLRAAFPILIQNCLEWLSASGDSLTNRSVKTGDAVPVPTLGRRGVLLVDCPDGASVRLPIEADRAVFDATDRAGLYQVRAGNAVHYAFVANLLSQTESKIKPRGEVTIGDRRITGGGAIVNANREIWRHLALLALLILALEWYAYHRRI